MKITLTSISTFREMHEMQHGFLSYALTAYRKTYTSNLLGIIKEIHPSITIENDFKTDDIIIDIPDELYTFTQIKYANYIRQRSD